MNVEKTIGCPVVVSLLVENNKISFISAHPKGLLLEDHPDFESKGFKLKETLKEKRLRTETTNYIQ